MALATAVDTTDRRVPLMDGCGFRANLPCVPSLLPAQISPGPRRGGGGVQASSTRAPRAPGPRKPKIHSCCLNENETLTVQDKNKGDRDKSQLKSKGEMMIQTQKAMNTAVDGRALSQPASGAPASSCPCSQS